MRPDRAWMDGRTKEWTHGQTDRRTDAWTDGRTDGRMHGRTGGRTGGRAGGRAGRRMDGCMDGRMDGRAGGRTDGRMDGRTDGRMDGWIDEWIDQLASRPAMRGRVGQADNVHHWSRWANTRSDMSSSVQGWCTHTSLNCRTSVRYAACLSIFMMWFCRTSPSINLFIMCSSVRESGHGTHIIHAHSHSICRPVHCTSVHLVAVIEFRPLA